MSMFLYVCMFSTDHFILSQWYIGVVVDKAKW